MHREITITESIVRESGRCSMCDWHDLTIETLEELDDEMTYVVKMPIGGTESSSVTLFLCHQHLCDVASAIMNATPNSGWE